MPYNASKRKPGLLVLLMEMCTCIWKERNAATYSHFLSRLPSWVLLRKTHLNFMLDICHSAKKHKQLREALDQLQTALKPWDKMEVLVSLNTNEEDE